MKILELLEKKRREKYFTEIDRLDALYLDIVVKKRSLLKKKQTIDWERYREYSDMVPEIIKPAEWTWLNQMLIFRGVVNSELLRRIPSGLLNKLSHFDFINCEEDNLPLFSFYNLNFK